MLYPLPGARIAATKKLISIVIAAVFITLSAHSQKEFFRSQQVFTPEQLSDFYSSVSVEKNLVLFIANNYRIYAYDKASGNLKWMNYTEYKTNTPAFVAGNYVYAGTYMNEQERATQFDIATGQLIKRLPVGPLQTQPVLKDSMLFGTAIYEGGCLFAYDLKRDSLTWWRFLAHGYTRQPYYTADHIWANAEETNWVTINYQGQLTDTNCAEKAEIFVSDIPCVKKFYALTHDGWEIGGKLAAAIFGRDYVSDLPMLTTTRKSFMLYKKKLYIMGSKGKLERSLTLRSLSKNIDEYAGGLTCLLKADDQTVFLMYNDWLVEYNMKKKKPERLLNLSAWEPHQVVMDEGNLWLISKKDGLLYGLSLQ